MATARLSCGGFVIATITPEEARDILEGKDTERVEDVRCALREALGEEETT